ncbi:3'-5' exonuclease [Dactylosporangium aurantiacum]|uniref:3'-5' exonuclease n=1 Tax=Dactylosporangium aurantiacum TaxID=35754 RepID=UPI0006931FFC|nr:3'-5' exonuclease [Dactylosporangium aurantiacum]MDG6100498.1 3'-5' exonuclease [Dactylosporangium aurantiacum]
MAHTRAGAAPSWRTARLVALDLEGTGAQDGADEAILEIAAVPLIDGAPDVATAYTTLVNPGRPIPARPWISPGLTNDALASAPPLAAVEPGLAALLDGAVLVGHNVRVDWRLLQRRCPSIRPIALLDTYKLARAVMNTPSYSLTNLLKTLDLTATVDTMAPGSQPHRALWDTVGTALLLGALIHIQWQTDPAIADLTAVADVPLDGGVSAPVIEEDQLHLF